MTLAWKCVNLNWRAEVLMSMFKPFFSILVMICLIFRKLKSYFLTLTWTFVTLLCCRLKVSVYMVIGESVVRS